MNANERELMPWAIKADLPLGVIVNFGAPQLEWRRYANTKRDRQ